MGREFTLPAHCVAAVEQAAEKGLRSNKNPGEHTQELKPRFYAPDFMRAIGADSLDLARMPLTKHPEP
jgi:hypothetical protein